MTCKRVGPQRACSEVCRGPRCGQGHPSSSHKQGGSPQSNANGIRLVGGGRTWLLRSRGPGPADRWGLDTEEAGTEHARFCFQTAGCRRQLSICSGVSSAL